MTRRTNPLPVASGEREEALENDSLEETGDSTASPQPKQADELDPCR